MGQLRTRKRALLIGLICLATVVLAAFFSSPGSGRLLPDGSTLHLTGLKVGPTNTFIHGRIVERVVGRVLPEKLVHGLIFGDGLRVCGFTLLRPTILEFGSPWTTSLTAQFRVEPARGPSKFLGQSNLRVNESSVDRNHRWIIQGDDGMRYLQWFGLQRRPEGLFSYISTSLFPRQVRWLTFRLEEGDPDGGTWKEVAAFRTQNPVIGATQAWQLPVGLNTQRFGDLEFELGKTILEPELDHSNDLWSCRAVLPFQVRRRGFIETNWNADHFLFEDASGNAGELMGATKFPDKGWLIYEPDPSLDPTLVWRISADFSLDSGWPVTNQYTVQVPIPLSALMKTNLHALPLEISMAGDFLFAEIRTNRTGLRLAFVGAKDQTGKDIAIRTGLWTDHRFPTRLNLRVTGCPIEVTLAFDRSVRVGFYTKPVWSPERPVYR